MKFNYELHKLKNGAEVLLIPSKEPYSATISAMLKSGAAFETSKTSGVTHFLEHTAMQATEKWPNKIELNALLEQLGGMYNASTGYEILEYYITVPYNKVEFGIDFIFEVLYKSTFNPEYIEIEKTIVLDELHKRFDKIWFRNHRFIVKSLAKNKTPYLFPILGNEKNIKRFSTNELKILRDIYHSPDRLLLVVVGNFNKTKTLKFIKEKFGNIENKKTHTEYPKQLIKNNVFKSKNDKEKTDLVFNTITIPYKGIKDLTHKESRLLSLSLNILGGPFTSRLMNRLREKEGLLYGITVHHDSTYKTGVISISANCKPEQFKKVFAITVEEIKRFNEKGITKDELNHFKDYIINNNLVRYDNVYAIANLIKTHKFYNKDILSLQDYIDIMKSLSLKEVNEYIGTIYKLNKAGALAYGNTNNSMTSYMRKLITK